MHSACKDIKFRGKKVVLLDRSTFQSLTPNQLNHVCNLYAILCTPNFLYECIRNKNLEEKLLNIDDTSFVMICESPQSFRTLQRYDIVKRDLTSLDDYLVTLVCVNRNNRKLIFPAISKDSDFFYQKAELEVRFYNELYNGFRGKIFDLLGGDKIAIRNILREGEKELGYRLQSSKIRDICKFAESHILVPQELIKVFHYLTKLDGTKIINGEEMEWALKRLHLYNNRPIETNFLRYARYFYFLGLCLVTFRASEGEHLDDSYVRDWEYLYFLPFCDLFVSGDSFFEHFVPSLPQSFGLNDKFISTDAFCHWC